MKQRDLAEWNRLAHELHELDPRAFERCLEALREVRDCERAAQAAERRIFALIPIEGVS